MEELSLKLTVNEINSVLEILKKEPYEKVYMIIGKIISQSNEQTKHTQNGQAKKEEVPAPTNTKK